MQITHDNDCEHRLGHDCTCGASSYQFDLAAARAENERLTKERDREALTREGILQKRINDLLARAEKAEAERDEARASLRHLEGFGRCTCGPCAIHGDAERDMRQRAADYLQSAADDWRSDGNEHEAKMIEDEIPGVLALPLKHADREEGK